MRTMNYAYINYVRIAAYLFSWLTLELSGAGTVSAWTTCYVFTRTHPLMTPNQGNDPSSMENRSPG